MIVAQHLERATYIGDERSVDFISDALSNANLTLSICCSFVNSKLQVRSLRWQIERSDR
jgi:hypothetical protein